MPKINIDGRTIEVAEGTTILKAAGLAGIHIPHLCYHEAFPPEGSCRLCLVEIEGSPKLELSCATVVRDGMVVKTQSEKVIEARRSVLEFLLAEHPLDCPICDKAGECKLQDYYEAYGLFESRFKESKEKKEKIVPLGRNLILDRERCIQCTRCVRFLLEITKTGELGVFERGIKSIIGFYEGEPVDNNYSGNLAELCPVGAITDLDFRFKTRVWFLEKRPSICPLCSRGCNLYIEIHKGLARIDLGQRVYRLRSRENLFVNKYWLCDLGRYSYHYLDKNRLIYPLNIKNGQPTRFSWEKIYSILVEKIKNLKIRKRTSRIVLILNSALTNEELFLFKKLFIEGLEVKRIIFCDPPDEAGDNFLLTKERVPNRRGALALGFDLEGLEQKLSQDKIDLLLIFAGHLVEKMPLNWLRAITTNIEAKFLFTCHETKLSELVDFVAPVTPPAEKAGSFINIEGRLQTFDIALEPLGESRPEWKILIDLAREIPVNYRFFGPLNSVKAIRKAMAEENLFFNENPC